MKFAIYCTTHACPAIPAGDELHFMPVGELLTVEAIVTPWTGVYELDWADLYCVGGTGTHKFYINIIDSVTDIAISKAVLMIDDDSSTICLTDHVGN